jgi:hypothetical protein
MCVHDHLHYIIPKFFTYDSCVFVVDVEFRLGDWNRVTWTREYVHGQTQNHVQAFLRDLGTTCRCLLMHKMFFWFAIAASVHLRYDSCFVEP